jgi:N-acetylneuraminic acid mutarotase
MLKPLVVVAALLCAFTVDANARGHHRHHSHHHRYHHHAHRGLPWCGMYMSKYFGKSDSRLARARQWAHVGSAASGPGVGVVVVWPHHVGVITGQTAKGQWIVHSGNDGGAVRTRPRSVAGAIAFRRV